MSEIKLHQLRRSLVKALTVTALSIVMSVTGVLVAMNAALAQEGEGEAQQETTKVQGISEKTYRKFAEAQELMEQEPADYAGAIKVLDQVKNKKNLTPTEAIQLYRIYGVIYFNQERYQEAIKAFETMLAQEGISERDRNDTMLTLAQLHFQIEDYQGAVDIFSEWFTLVPNPPPEPYIYLATAYYQLERYDQMIEPVENAIRVANERDVEVKEQWWLLLRVPYYEQENYKKVAEILEVLVVGWPKKEYWTMLSAMYGELDLEKRQLAAYEAAYDQNLLEKSAELVTLSQLLMQAEAGYKAALILEKGLADGIVEKNESNYRLLSQAWQMASEFEKAIGPLQEAARVSGDGELDIRLANSFLNLSRYDECIEATRAGLNKGGLDRPAIAHELLGMCQFEKEKYEDAKKSFRQAARDEKIQKRARNWIKYIESEQARISQINESIRQARLARDELDKINQQ